MAVYAGITMLTPPLSAGELSRPLVGETEKLLVDIMSRAHLLPHLICAVTIDEIDSLVPRRDNNTKEHKVDRISVLLSHIEGVKNVPNLIVFGATNRLNTMDDAFLRRMQAKVFVGRPSPGVRNKMLLPLIYTSMFFTPERIDALVKITTNLSGAAVTALRSKIVVELKRNPALDDHRLLNLSGELTDTVAREFHVWFGISTLPSIARLNSNRNIAEGANFSLVTQGEQPSGRILIDLQSGKCFVEFQGDNHPTIEHNLVADEVSAQALLARLIQGCSSRNIDTIQLIDLNFLTKRNATDENKIFEASAEIFLECDGYNKSMLVFDMDSLIMMSTSNSITNTRLYQFIREKCKVTFVEQEQVHSQTGAKPMEKWVVLIVKDTFL